MKPAANSLTNVFTNTSQGRCSAFWDSSGDRLTWQLVHAVGRAEVVLQGAVGVHGHVEVELGSEGEQAARVVGVFDGSDTNAEQPVDVQHLLLEGRTE